MLRKAFMAAAAVSSLLITDVALAQDGGIWASRPRPRRIVKRPAAAVSPLQSLYNGQVVKNSSGNELGTISQIVTGSNGAISQVIVRSASGQTYTLSPGTLSVSDGVVVTTDATAGS